MHSPPQAVLRAVSGLACLVLLWTAPAAFAGDDVVFRHFSTREGLSQSRVAALYHAPDGFLWVGTQDGLNRFDGYEFRVYRHDPEDIGSLADNQINVLTADSRGRLLVGSRKGLNRYRAAGGDFDTLPVTDGVQALLEGQWEFDRVWRSTLFHVEPDRMFDVVRITPRRRCPVVRHSTQRCQVGDD